MTRPLLVLFGFGMFATSCFELNAYSLAFVFVAGGLANCFTKGELCE